MSGTPPPDGLSEVIGKAIVDDDFYGALKKDPDGALQGTSLSQGDKDTLKRLLRDKPQVIEKARKDYLQSPLICVVIVEFPPTTS
jgi:hypothetical protein